MGIARQQVFAVPLALVQQQVEQRLDGKCYFPDFVAQVELHVHQHLVVARAAAVDFFAHVAQFARQFQFHLRVDVLNACFHPKIPGFDAGVNGLQFHRQNPEFLRRQQPNGFQHADMRQRSQYVKRR